MGVRDHPVFFPSPVYQEVPVFAQHPTQQFPPLIVCCLFQHLNSLIHFPGRITPVLLRPLRMGMLSNLHIPRTCRIRRLPS
ncbi:hypothetical protein SISNIDRAFT_447526 [Sistotremastrum niveocremeum HHB9708]|uniref:Uncharacterized protein n=1 Tax=Sistotremastrum niveocremeum HHB9708 TaxID=1314777 RepID=A0A165ABD3_9AGAM|nr:hypothetical protein SISNIDRAFT_447526 [Sistotremastrum niveocremeum HHB9708]